MLVNDYLKESGRDLEDVAAQINEVNGGSLTANSIRLRKYKPMPKTWAGALGLDWEPPAPRDHEATEQRDGEPPLGGLGGERPPKPPPNAKLAPPIATLTPIAKARLTEVYGLAGLGGSYITKNPGVQKVTDDMAPNLAESWIKAASEGNELAQRVVRLATAGGSMSELVICHLIWLAGVAYVIGASPLDPLGAWGAKYGQYRPAPEPRPRPGTPVEPSPGGDGADGAGAAVGEPGRTTIG